MAIRTRPCGEWPEEKFVKLTDDEEGAEKSGIATLSMLLNKPMTELEAQFDISRYGSPTIEGLTKVLNKNGYRVFEAYDSYYNKRLDIDKYLLATEKGVEAFLYFSGRTPEEKPHWELIYIQVNPLNSANNCYWIINPMKEKPKESGYFGVIQKLGYFKYNFERYGLKLFMIEKGDAMVHNPSVWEEVKVRQQPPPRPPPPGSSSIDQDLLRQAIAQNYQDNKPKPAIGGEGPCGEWPENRFVRQDRAESCGKATLEMLLNGNLTSTYARLGIQEEGNSISELTTVLNQFQIRVFEQNPVTLIDDFWDRYDFIDYLQTSEIGFKGFIMNTGTNAPGLQSHWVMMYVKVATNPGEQNCIWYLDAKRDRPTTSLTVREANTELQKLMSKNRRDFGSAVYLIEEGEEMTHDPSVWQEVKGDLTPGGAAGTTVAIDDDDPTYEVAEGIERDDPTYATVKGGESETSQSTVMTSSDDESEFSTTSFYDIVATPNEGNRPPALLPTESAPPMPNSGIPNLYGNTRPPNDFYKRVKFGPSFETSDGVVVGKITCNQTEEWWDQLTAVFKNDLFYLEDNGGNKYEQDARLNRFLTPIWYFSNNNTVLLVKPLDTRRSKLATLEKLDKTCPVIRSKLFKIANPASNVTHLLVMENASKFVVNGNDEIDTLNNINSYQQKYRQLYLRTPISSVYYTIMGYYIGQMVRIVECLYNKGILISDFKPENFVVSACSGVEEVLVIDIDELISIDSETAGIATYFYSEAFYRTPVTQRELYKQALFAIVCTMVRMYSGHLLYRKTDMVYENYEYNKDYILANNLTENESAHKNLKDAFEIVDTFPNFETGLFLLNNQSKLMFGTEDTSAPDISDDILDPSQFARDLGDELARLEVNPQEEYTNADDFKSLSVRDDVSPSADLKPTPQTGGSKNPWKLKLENKKASKRALKEKWAKARRDKQA